MGSLAEQRAAAADLARGSAAECVCVQSAKAAQGGLPDVSAAGFNRRTTSAAGWRAPGDPRAIRCGPTSFVGLSVRRRASASGSVSSLQSGTPHVPERRPSALTHLFRLLAYLNSTAPFHPNPPLAPSPRHHRHLRCGTLSGRWPTRRPGCPARGCCSRSPRPRPRGEDWGDRAHRPRGARPAGPCMPISTRRRGSDRARGSLPKAAQLAGLETTMRGAARSGCARRGARVMLLGRAGAAVRGSTRSTSIPPFGGVSHLATAPTPRELPIPVYADLHSLFLGPPRADCLSRAASALGVIGCAASYAVQVNEEEYALLMGQPRAVRRRRGSTSSGWQVLVWSAGPRRRRLSASEGFPEPGGITRRWPSRPAPPRR